MTIIGIVVVVNIRHMAIPAMLKVCFFANFVVGDSKVSGLVAFLNLIHLVDVIFGLDFILKLERVIFPLVLDVGALFQPLVIQVKIRFKGSRVADATTGAVQRSILLLEGGDAGAVPAPSAVAGKCASGAATAMSNARINFGFY